MINLQLKGEKLKRAGKLFVIIIFMFIGAMVECEESNISKIDFTEKYRLNYHFMPEKGWMNDPNGLVFYKDEYHLFYQYYPNGTEWGAPHWGHAVSKDLLHWEYLPIALYPDRNGYIFSGSVVVDKNNSSGFFGEEKEGLVAVFTHAGSRQHQSIAYSKDRGRTWTKYEGNPVIRNSIKRGFPDDFRDPKVSWNKMLNRWIMVIAAGDHIELWSSENLKEWTKESEFGKNMGAHGGVWECPDLFEMAVNNGDEKKWVMIVSLNPGNRFGGSGTQYFIGELKTVDGKLNFVTEQNETKWVDGGKDNYAGITWENIENKRYFIGWMSNWEYCNITPTNSWRGAMTLPREMELVKKEEKLFLRSRPIQNMDSIIENVILEKDKIENGESIKIGECGSTSKIAFEVDRGNESCVEAVLKNGTGESVTAGYDFVTNRGYINREMIKSAKEIQGLGGVHYIEMDYKPTKIFVEIYSDKSSIELFVNNGDIVITDLIFPKEEFNEIEIRGKMIKNFKIKKIKNSLK